MLVGEKVFQPLTSWLRIKKKKKKKDEKKKWDGSYILSPLIIYRPKTSCWTPSCRSRVSIELIQRENVVLNPLKAIASESSRIQQIKWKFIRSHNKTNGYKHFRLNVKFWSIYENASSCYLNYGTDEQNYINIVIELISFPKQRPTWWIIEKQDKIRNEN